MSHPAFITNMEHMIPTNIKYFWSYVNSLKKDSDIPFILYLNGINLTNEQAIIGGFVNHFQSCYNYYDNSARSAVSNFQYISTLHFTKMKIEPRLKPLDVKKGAGSDGVPPVFLKNCWQTLAEPLCKIFQHNLNMGVFPSL